MKHQSYNGWSLILFLILTLSLAGHGWAMGKKTDRYKRGHDQLMALDGQAADRLMSVLSPIAPDVVDFIIEFAYGDVYTRPGLDVKERQVATIAALTAL